MARKKTRTEHEAKKLDALRRAAWIGFTALDRGQFKEFKDADEIERYLNKITDQTIRKSPCR